LVIVFTLDMHSGKLVQSKYRPTWPTLTVIPQSSLWFRSGRAKDLLTPAIVGRRCRGRPGPENGQIYQQTLLWPIGISFFSLRCLPLDTAQIVSPLGTLHVSEESLKRWLRFYVEIVLNLRPPLPFAVFVFHSMLARSTAFPQLPLLCALPSQGDRPQ